MKIECTVEELKELLKKETPLECSSKDVPIDILLCGKKIN